MMNLSTRILSAAAAIVVLILLTLYAGTVGMKWFVVFAVVLCTYEYIEVVFSKVRNKLFKLLFFVTNISIFFLLSDYHILGLTLLPALLIIYLVICILGQKYFDAIEDLFVFVCASIVGFVYIGLFSSIAEHILDFNKGLLWFFWILAVVLMGDTCAYFAGHRFGKHKLSARISPKKTVEGAVGGLVGSLIGSVVVSFFIGEVPFYFFVVAPIFLGVAAQCGDLFESLFKRVANVKDSGSMLPGHGGILDRIDGVLFAVPVAYLLLILAQYLV